MLDTTQTEKKRNRVEGGQSEEEHRELKQGYLEELSVDHKWLDSRHG